MFKRSILLLVTVGLFLGMSIHLNSCKEIDEWTKYAMAYDSDIELNPSELNVQDSLYEVSGEYQINFNNELDKRAVKEKQIEKITLQMLELSFRSTSKQRDFSFIGPFTFTLSGPEFPERVIAEGDTLKSGLSVSRFKINQTDGMIDLMKANEFVIKFKFKLKEPLSKDAQVVLTTRFELDARQFFI